jgi:DNA-binding CsgD family transcriptional regulator
MSLSDVFPSQVREFLREDPSPKRAAVKFDINVATVYRHCKGMDLKLIRRSKRVGLTKTSEIIRVLVENREFTQAEIATKLGVTKSYVSEVLSND